MLKIHNNKGLKMKYNKMPQRLPFWSESSLYSQLIVPEIGSISQSSWSFFIWSVS